MSKFSDKFVDGMSLVAEKSGRKQVPWCNQGIRSPSTCRSLSLARS